ncbi:hypothetical protein LXL04_012757 [Taraxacum kok-saghyz]
MPYRAISSESFSLKGRNWSEVIEENVSGIFKGSCDVRDTTTKTSSLKLAEPILSLKVDMSWLQHKKWQKENHREKIVSLVPNIQDTKCPLCNKDGETILHSFLNCESAQFSWMRLGLWWSIAIPNFNTMDEIWSRLDGSQLTNKARNRLWTTIIAIMKSLWEARNAKIFNNIEKSKEVVFRGAQNLAFTWLQSMDSKFNIDSAMWFRSPYDTMFGYPPNFFPSSNNLNNFFDYDLAGGIIRICEVHQDDECPSHYEFGLYVYGLDEQKV